MAPNPKVMQAVKELGYRVTVGDVAAKAGLDVNFAQRELLTLASEAGGHLQVAESGDIAYLFPNNFPDILRNKFWRLQLQEWWQKIWRILFYLIRISFGIVLVASLLLIFVAIAILLSSGSDNNNGGGGWGRQGRRLFLLSLLLERLNLAILLESRRTFLPKAIAINRPKTRNELSGISVLISIWRRQSQLQFRRAQVEQHCRRYSQQQKCRRRRTNSPLSRPTRTGIRLRIRRVYVTSPRPF